jgi:hypothetical protein
VRNETSPEDVGGMHAAAGILTARGGMTSHAAVVARGWGKCCVSGCSEIRVNETNKVSSSVGLVSSFFVCHLGIYNEAFTFFDSSREFDGICVSNTIQVYILCKDLHT